MSCAPIPRPRLRSPRIGPAVGALIAVPGYSDGTVESGHDFRSSRLRASGRTAIDFGGRDAFVLVDAANALRYPPRAGTDGAALGGAVLTQNEVRTLLQSAFDVAESRSRADPPAGRVAGACDDLGRRHAGRDSRHRAHARRTRVRYGRVAAEGANCGVHVVEHAGAFLAALPDAKYLSTTDASVGVTRAIAIGGYVTALRTFLNDGNALADGRIAFTDRANGNLSRPFFPDGIDNEGAGPLEQAGGRVESVLDRACSSTSSINAILQHVLFVAGAGVPDVAPGCAGVAARQRSQQRRPDDRRRAARQRSADLPGQRADLSRRHAHRRARRVR